MAHTSHRASAERYSGLRLLSAIFTVLGALLLPVGSLLLASGLYDLLPVWMGQPPGAEAPFARRSIGGVSFPASLGGAVSALWGLGLLMSSLQYLAMGTVIRLVININANTRFSAQCLEQLRSREEPMGQNAGALFRS
jgi:hypothetical protein